MLKINKEDADGIFSRRELILNAGDGKAPLKNYDYLEVDYRGEESFGKDLFYINFYKKLDENGGRELLYSDIGSLKGVRADTLKLEFYKVEEACLTEEMSHYHSRDIEAEKKIKTLEGEIESLGRSLSLEDVEEDLLLLQEEMSHYSSRDIKAEEKLKFLMGRKEELTPVFEYGMRSRPFSIGTYPKNENFVKATEGREVDGKGYYNMLLYSSPLTSDEIEHFQLDDLAYLAQGGQRWDKVLSTVLYLIRRGNEDNYLSSAFYKQIGMNESDFDKLLVKNDLADPWDLWELQKRELQEANDLSTIGSISEMDNGAWLLKYNSRYSESPEYSTVSLEEVKKIFDGKTLSEEDFSSNITPFAEKDEAKAMYSKIFSPTEDGGDIKKKIEETKARVQEQGKAKTASKNKGKRP